MEKREIAGERRLAISLTNQANLGLPTFWLSWLTESQLQDVDEYDRTYQSG